MKASIAYTVQRCKPAGTQQVRLPFRSSANEGEPATVSVAGLIMPLLSRRHAAQKSSLCSPEAPHSGAPGAFDPTRGGLPPPRAPPPDRRHVCLLFTSSENEGEPATETVAGSPVSISTWAVPPEAEPHAPRSSVPDP